MRWIWIAVLLAASACVRSESVDCGDGSLCPSGLACDVQHGLCVLPEQLASCAGLADGTSCAIEQREGTCFDEVCLAQVCGDGLVTGAEQCDGENLAAMTCEALGAHQAGTLGCTTGCAFDVSACGPICGNGVVDGPMGAEECDGGDVPAATDDCTELGFYDPGPLTCSTQCGLVDNACTGFCGDGQRNGEEYCDGDDPEDNTCLDIGLDAGRLGCNAFCAPDFDRCSALGWRTSSIGGAEDVLGIWARDESDIFAVARNGTIQRFTGTAWMNESSGTTANLNAVWGQGADVFAVGTSRTIVRRTGGAWIPQVTPAETQAFEDVWGAAPDDVYAVGRALSAPDGTIVHFDGTAWTRVHDAVDTVRAVTGSSATDVWAGDQQGFLHHFDGSTWTTTSLSGSPIDDLHAFATDNVWAISNRAYRYDGASWSVVPGSPFQLREIWASGPNNIYAIGATTIWHHDGLAWTEHELPQGVFAWSIGGASPRAVFIGASSGGIVRYEGAAYLKAPNLPAPVVAAWGAARDDYYALASSGHVYHFDGATWTQDLGVPTNSNHSSIWGTSSTDVYIGGSSAIQHRSASGWSTHTVPAGTAVVTGIWGQGPTVFASATTNTARGRILRRTGTTWTAEPIPDGSLLRGIWGRGPDEVFAVGYDGRIVHYDGTAWTDMVTPTQQHYDAIWGDATTVLVVSRGGEILRYDGSAWQIEPGRNFGPLHSIWGAAADDVFASGANALVHFDGVRWSPVRLPIGTVAANVSGVRDRVALAILSQPGKVLFLSRQVLWHCRATETACADSIDDDCDGAIDAADPDC